MPYRAPDDGLELFNRQKVELVTGVKSATLRQWETRGVYTCELRRKAEFELGVICAPDTPDRLMRSAAILANYERGWRSYTIADLLRITLLKRLLDLGMEAQCAGKAVLWPVFPESDPNSQPNGRKLMRMYAGAADAGDREEHFVAIIFVDTEGNRSVWGESSRRWDKIEKAIKRIASGSAAVVVSLDDVRRQVLRRLEEVEGQ